MKGFKWVFILSVTFLAVNLVGITAGVFADDRSLGEKLVRQLFTEVKAGNMEAIGKMTAQGFQSIHEDGARDRTEELELIKGINLGEFTMTDLQVTRNGPVITATYFISVEETIKGQRLPATKPAARLSAWLKTDSGWKWIIHANLRSLK